MDLLHSSTYEVRKYAAKSMAYLSLRNGKIVLLFIGKYITNINFFFLKKKNFLDKYKSALVKDGRVKILTSVIELVDENLAKANQVTISHACCAMVSL
jgi:hypothetical protein